MLLNCSFGLWSSFVSRHAAYWSSWQGQAVCNSPEFKEYLGLDSEDSCLGFFILGNSDAGSSYRSKRGSMADKVQWK